MVIQATIDGVEYNTEMDEKLINFISGALFKKDEQYYLYCRLEVLNNKIRNGGLFDSEFPSAEECSESMIPNYADKEKAMVLGLGDEEFVKRTVTDQITLIPIENLVELFIYEIKRSKVSIKNCVVLSDKYPMFNFEGRTYGLEVSGCTFIPMLDELNIPEHNECYLKVNPSDEVLKKKTDDRGYPQSCGIENKNKDVVIIVRGSKDA